MPDLDLDPGDYRERKPKGWRWRLPWSDPRDAKLFLVLSIICGGFVVYFVANTPGSDSQMAMFGGAMFGFLSGACLMWSLRD